MTLLVETNVSWWREAEYCVQYLFQNYFGLAVRMIRSNRSGFRISTPRAAELLLPSGFFGLPERAWMTNESLPSVPLKIWDSRELELPVNLTDFRIPMIYSDGAYAFEKTRDRIVLPFDIFGSVFYMLTRYGEAVTGAQDVHGRFPGSESLAVQEAFIRRPIVDEYAEILWACLHYLWPGLSRKQRVSSTVVTCDLDHPYVDTCNTFLGAMRHIAGDLLHRKSVQLAACNAVSTLRRRMNRDFSSDPYLRAVDWMMQQNERNGNRMVFYLLTGMANDIRDGDYTLDDPLMQKLIERMHAGGHEIGLHAGYGSYRDQQRFCQELNILRTRLAELNLTLENPGSRQHYLRWHPLKTVSIWEQAGLDYDSTLYYPEHPGFRCGTCHEFSLFDLQHRKRSNVKERPLIAMDVSFSSTVYLGLGYTGKAYDHMHALKKTCHQFGGSFILLWHNSELVTEAARMIYQDIIK